MPLIAKCDKCNKEEKFNLLDIPENWYIHINPENNKTIIACSRECGIKLSLTMFNQEDSN